MKYIRVKKNMNIANFKVHQNNIAFNNKSNDLFVNDSLLVNNHRSYFFYESYLCYHTEAEETIFYDCFTKKCFKIDVFFHKDNFINNNFLTSKNIFRSEEGKWLSDLYLYQLTPFKELKKIDYYIEGGYHRLENNILQILNRKNIQLYNLENAQTVWHFSLSSKYNYFKEADYQGEPPVEVQAEVIKFLGVYKDELWLVLNSGLLALDIKTGTETRYIKDGKMALGEPFFEDFKGYFGYDTILDEEKGIIFNLNLHFYIEYDLNSNKNYFDSYSFKDSSQKNGLVLNYIGGYDAENIYAYEGSKNNRFAIFSRDKKEIIWSGEIPEAKDKFPAIKDLQYGAGKLYVLDHYNTLHIFEGEIDRN